MRPVLYRIGIVLCQWKMFRVHLVAASMVRLVRIMDGAPLQRYNYISVLPWHIIYRWVFVELFQCWLFGVVVVVVTCLLPTSMHGAQ